MGVLAGRFMKWFGQISAELRVQIIHIFTYQVIAIPVTGKVPKKGAQRVSRNYSKQDLYQLGR